MQQSFLGGHGSSAEDRLEYFYLNLVGQLVHVHTTDRAIIEGLFVSRIDPNQYPDARKQQCKNQIGGVILRYYRYCQSPLHGVSDPAKLNENDLLIYYDQLLFMEVASLKLRTKTPGSGQVQTFRGGRDLEKLDWAGTEELLEGGVIGVTSPRGGGGVGNWDQFKTNEQKFGVKSSYKEEHYTTKLDKAEFTSDQIKQAEAVAQEIEKTIPTHGAAHLMDRHEIASEDVDEGQLFSDVIRPSDGGSKVNPPPPPPCRNALEQSTPVMPSSNASNIARGKGGKNANTNTNTGMVAVTGGSRSTVTHAGGPASMGKGNPGAVSTPVGLNAGASPSSTASSIMNAKKGDGIAVGGAGNNAVRSLDGIGGGAEVGVSGGPHLPSARPMPSSSIDVYLAAAPFHPMSPTYDDFLETVGTALQQNPRNADILECWPGDENILVSGGSWPSSTNDANYSTNTGKMWAMDQEESNLSHGGGMMMHGAGGGLPGGGSGGGGGVRMSGNGGVPSGSYFFESGGPGMIAVGMPMKVRGGLGGGGGVVPQSHGGVLPHGGPGGMGNMHHMGHPMNGNGGSGGGGGGLPAHFHDSINGMSGGGHLHSLHHNGGGNNGGGYNNGSGNNNGNGANNTSTNGMLGMSHPHHLGNNANNSNTNNNNANSNNFQGGGGGGNPNSIPLSRHGMSGQQLPHTAHPSTLAPPPQGHSSVHYSMVPMNSSHPPSHHPGPAHASSSSSSSPMGVSGHPSSAPGIGHHSGRTGTGNNTNVNGEGSGNSGSNTNLGAGGGNSGGGGMYATGGGIKGSPTPPQNHLLVPGGGTNPNMPPGPIYSGGNGNAMRNNGGYMGGGSGVGGYVEISPALYGNNSNNNVPSPVMGGTNDSSGLPLNINSSGHMFHNNNNTNNSILTTAASTTPHHTPTPSSASAASNKNGNNHSSSPSLPPPPSSSNHSPSHQIGGSTGANNAILSNQNSSNNNGNLQGNSGPVGGRGGASRQPKMTQQQPHQPVGASSSNASGGGGVNTALSSHPSNHHAHHSHHPPEANHMNSSGSPPPPPGGAGGGAIMTNVESGINVSGKSSNLQEKNTANLSGPATTASTGTRKLRRGGRDDKRGSK